MSDTGMKIGMWIEAKWNGTVHLSWDTDPNIYFTGQCYVLDMLYLMSYDNYFTVIKDVICMQV